jgi:hypothetical protein
MEPGPDVGPMTTGSFILDAIVFGFLTGFVVAVIG